MAKVRFGVGDFQDSGASMHVLAFAPSTRAVALDAGGVRSDGFPMTSAYVDTFPKQITIPLVLAVYTQGGIDYDPRRYIVARSPDGERLSTLECTWHWPDKPGVPVKFWVTHPLPTNGGAICRRTTASACTTAPTQQKPTIYSLCRWSWSTRSCRLDHSPRLACNRHLAAAAPRHRGQRVIASVDGCSRRAQQDLIARG